MVGQRSNYFRLSVSGGDSLNDLTRKWALAADKDNVDDAVCEKYDISKEK